MPEKVALIGSGNWGSAIATKIGKNVLENDMFDKEVQMWVFEEYVKQEEGKWVRPARGAKPPEGKTWVDEGYEPLTEVINRLHENVIYLPGIPLPKSIIAQPDIKKAVTGATMMVFVIPHNFLAPIVPKMEGAFAPGAVGISLIKGIEFKDSKPILISDLLAAEMAKAEGAPKVDMSVLMGANVANEVAKGDFAEATVGCTDLEIGKKWVSCFNTSDFKVDPVTDVAGAELCGALKNVVALGAGFVDGMGLGNNSKAAIIRIGMMEMKKFIQNNYPKVRDSTFFESCGVADLIVTCYGGRNRKCAEAFVRAAGTKTFEQIERELLDGQKIQGTGTAQEVMTILRKDGTEKDYPLLTSIYKISFENAPVESMLDTLGAYGRLPSQAA